MASTPSDHKSFLCSLDCIPLDILYPSPVVKDMFKSTSWGNLYKGLICFIVVFNSSIFENLEYLSFYSSDVLGPSIVFC